MGRGAPGLGSISSGKLAASVELSRKGEIMNLSYLDKIPNDDKSMMQSMLDISRVVVMSNQMLNKLKANKAFSKDDLDKLEVARNNGGILDLSTLNISKD